MTLSPALMVLVLALLLGIQPITTDLYLPALPALRAHFDAPMTGVQLTLSALIISFGIGQLIGGPVADRYGRRPVLLAGLSLYVVAAVLSAAAPSIDVLVAARALQGLGMAASVVCGRAMVRDLFEPHDGTRVMSKGLSGLGIIALLSPVIGGLLAGAYGWGAPLLATGVFGAATLALVALRLPETLRERNPSATQPAVLIKTFAQVGRHPTFIAWTALIASSYAGLYAFLAASSFTLITTFGLSREVYGLLVASSSVSYLLGTVVCRRWLLRHGIRGAVQRAGGFSLAAAALYAVPALAQPLGLNASFGHTLWTLIAAQWLYAFAHGIHQPCGQAGVAGPFPRMAGSASALSGFVLALGAFLMGLWLGRIVDGSVQPYALTIAVFSAVTAAIALTLVQRHGEAAPIEAAPT